MAIDISHEQLVTLTTATKQIPGRPHLSTLWRWAERGVKGVKLETCRVGGRRFTSDEAIQRFVSRLSGDGGALAAAPGISPKPPSPARAKRLAAAEAELQKLGI